MKRIRSWIVTAWGFIKRHIYFSIAVVGIIVVVLLLWLPLKFGEYQTIKVDPTTNKPTEVDIQYRTGWDLLGILIIPTVLAVGALLFNKSARDSEQRIATDRQNEASIQAYLVVCKTCFDG
jgi:heme A synthase